MTKIYKQAFTEVYEILSYLDEDAYNKIPNDVINALENNRDLNYDFFIDENVPFYEQNLLEETRAILFNLYRDYLANSKIKGQIIKYQREEQINLEKIKQEQYSYNNLFKKNSSEIKKDSSKNEQSSLVKYDDEKNIFMKLIKNFKRLWNKK